MSASLPGYAAQAADLAQRFDALDAPTLYRHVTDVIPTSQERVLDVGAGTGRDAAFWAGRGCLVTAVEPVQPLWRHRELDWIEDKLPALDRVRALGTSYDVITLIGVWHHLTPQDRLAGWPVLASLARPGARALLRLREGPGTEDRPVWPVNPSVEAQAAICQGFQVLFQRPTHSLGAANRASHVRWTWLGLQKPAD